MEHLETWQIVFLQVWLSSFFVLLAIAVIAVNWGSSETRHMINQARFERDLRSDDEE